MPWTTIPAHPTPDPSIPRQDTITSELTQEDSGDTTTQETTPSRIIGRSRPGYEVHSDLHHTR